MRRRTGGGHSGAGRPASHAFGLPAGHIRSRLVLLVRVPRRQARSLGPGRAIRRRSSNLLLGTSSAFAGADASNRLHRRLHRLAASRFARDFVRQSAAGRQGDNMEAEADRAHGISHAGSTLTSLSESVRLSVIVSHDKLL